jgi:DNA mismatch repair ATPase MutS
LLLKKLNLDVKDFHSFNSDLVNNEHGFLAALNDYFVLLKRIEYRNNYLVNILLNLTLGWDQHLVRQVKFWKIKYGNHLGEWQNKLSQFEVWISGAIYYYNFPKSCFAQYNESNIVEIDGLVHPFLQFKMNAQFNNCSISENQHFIIITGPNMAGKSTYLRSVGTAFFLANAGFPIAAKSCSIPRCKLFTSMRTADDLNEGNSYFFAELSRLKLIVNEMENGNRLFVILDEILKGTNSRDKEMGSAKFLQKLNTLGGKGLIATHDLSLCELANDSGSFINRYFDSKIIDQKLSFDYKIYNGVCQNMNATFLLKSMNLID